MRLVVGAAALAAPSYRKRKPRRIADALAAAAVSLLAGAPGPSSAAPMSFVEIAEEAGISAPRHCSPRSEFGNPAWIAGGGAVEDFNGDGLLDIFLVQGDREPCLLYINQGDGTFLDQASALGVDIREHGSSAAAADFDNDGDLDIAVSLLRPPHILLRGDGQGGFERDDSLMPAPTRDGSSPSWGDVDNDGRLELALGQWQFTNAAPRLWLYRPTETGGLESYGYTNHYAADKNVFGARFADIDGDRLQDLLVVSDFGNSQLHRNDGGGQFRWWTPATGAGIEENGMGNAVGDYDNDGDLDWYVTSIFDPPRGKLIGNRLYRNDGDAAFADVTADYNARDGNWGWGASFGDLDLDGDLDLYHVNGWPWGLSNEPNLTDYDDQPARLFEHELAGRLFIDRAAASGAADAGQGRGVALADFDDDGDLDIFIVNNQVVDQTGPEIVRELPAPPSLYRNETVRDGRGWLKVRLEGNRPAFHGAGIGSRVYVQTGSTRMTRELHASTNFMCMEPGRIAHFGLGTAARVDEVVAEWVNGDAVVAFDVAPNQEIVLPSPNASLSSRHLQTGEALTLDASSVEPPGAIKTWIVDGLEMSDPATYAFESPGAKEARLDVFEAGGTAPLRSEFYRLTVVEPKPSARSAGLVAR